MAGTEERSYPISKEPNGFFLNSHEKVAILMRNNQMGYGREPGFFRTASVVTAPVLIENPGQRLSDIKHIPVYEKQGSPTGK